MDEQDDPEDHTRPVEHSLPDPAPAPMPWGRRLLRWWRVFTVVATAAIGLYVYFGVSDGLKILPSEESGSGGILAPLRTPSLPAPPPAASVVPVLADQPSTVNADESLHVTGNAVARTVICAGGSVTVSGLDNTVLVTGDCLRVGVAGSGNIVRVTSAAMLEVSGTDNHVTYYSGDPHITNPGFTNIVEPA
ncbi:MAG: DUF3060 domain-containing protein [Mycobacterium sp.]